MAQIPEYTRGIIRPRAVADYANPQAIAAAGQNYGQALDAAAQIAMKFQEANEATAVNEAIIRKQREDIDFFEQEKQRAIEIPDGFAKTFEEQLKARDEQYIKELPTESAKTAFKQAASRLNLRNYEQGLGWENNRKAEIYAGRIQNSLDNLEVIEYRNGQMGAGSLDESLKNLDATIVAGSTVISPEQLDGLRKSEAKKLVMARMQGQIASDPNGAISMIESGKYDDILGADGLNSLYASISKTQKKQWEKMPALGKLDVIASGKAPLSVRNNNPGNIRDSKTGEFRKFASAEEGQQAMVDDLRVKISGKSSAMAANFGKGYKPTLANLIATWAPSSENDTQAYINTVSRDTGIAPDQVLTEQNIPSLMRSMTKVEGGSAAANYFSGNLQVEADKLRAEVLKDPAKAAIEYGATTPQEMVDVQAKVGIAPDMASVMSRDQASSIAMAVAQAKNSDDVIAQALQFTETFGDYSQNAITDLQKYAKMPPAVSAAFSLALKGDERYKPHIDILTQAFTESYDEEFTKKGNSNADLNAVLTEELEDIEQMLFSEGYSRQQISDRIEATRQLAKGAIIRNPSLSLNEAVEFAMQPYNDSYNTGYFGGADYRVPSSYPVDDIDDRLPMAYMDAIKPLEEEYAKKGYTLRSNIRAVLNQEEDGLLFLDTFNTPILMQDGSQLRLSFDDILSKKNSAEIESEKISKSYGTGQYKAIKVQEGTTLDRARKNVRP